MNQILLLLAVSIISLSSCEMLQSGHTNVENTKNADTTTALAEITRISTGSSFGMCVGYCRHEVIITPKLLKSVQKGTRSGELPEKNAEEQLPQSEWSDIVSKADWEKFKNLPETIGCPDCADGGAE